MGLLHLTNVNREEQREKFWNYFHVTEGHPFRFCFLPGFNRQWPSLFAERMVYELIQEEVDDELSAVFFPARPNGRLKEIPLPHGNTLKKCQKYFQRYFLETFNAPEASTFEEFIRTELSNLPYKYIFLPFELNEFEIGEHTYEYLAWISDTFSANHTRQEMPTFLFFFIVNLADLDINSQRDPSNSQSEILNRLVKIFKGGHDFLIQVFENVKESSLIEWLGSMGERNPAKREQLIRAFVKSLPQPAQERYAKERSFDMINVARLQELIFELHNQ